MLFKNGGVQMNRIIFDRINLFKKLYLYFKPYHLLYCCLAVLKTISLVLSLIAPVFYMILINDVMVEGNLIQLVWVVLGYLSVFLLQSLITVFNKIVYNKIFIKFNLKLRMTLLSKFGKIKTEVYEGYSAGDIKNRIEGDAGLFEKFFITHGLNFVFAIISATVIVIIMLRINWFLAIFSFVMVPFSFLFAKFMSKRARKVSDDYRENYGKYESFIHSTIQNWKEIKANSLQPNQEIILADYWKLLSNLFVKNQVYWYINRAFIAFKDFFITKMNLYFLGGILIILGRMEVALLLTFMNYYEQFFSNISSISDSIVGFKNDKPSIDRVVEILDLEEPSKKTAKKFNSEIKLENLFFNYPQNQQEVLKGVSLLISRNEQIAIVGRSGCGKSTLIKLILGMYEPTKGRILFDETNIKEITVKQKIGVIMQEPYMFNLSIKENLKLAKRTASEDEIDAACKKANIYDFIQNLPDRYETVIGERGVKLSGGQKQRLAIARTLLYDPEIVVFDEATSSLDSENEKAIVSTIKHLTNGKTVITIAHRLSSILDANRVAVMNEGKIVAYGPHSELKGKNEIYDLLFAKQYNMEVQN